jgi:hypothetical protein
MKIWNEQESYTREMGFDMKQEVDASFNAIYVGMAFPGALTSESKWAIKKMAYDANNNMTTLRFAGGSDAFDKIWDNRATYTYIGI